MTYSKIIFLVLIDDTLAMVRGGSVHYYHKDALGSITAMTDVNGQVAQTYEYDSFGNIANQTGNIENPFTYTGREYDAETGLYFYRTRSYDQKSGRFASEDLIGFRGGLNLYEATDSVGKPSVSQANLYNFVDNNPANEIDPLGKNPGNGVANAGNACQLLNYFFNFWAGWHTAKYYVSCDSCHQPIPEIHSPNYRPPVLCPNGCCNRQRETGCHPPSEAPELEGPTENPRW